MLLNQIVNSPRFYKVLPDGGPLYAETNLNNIIAEPFNAFSSLAFLLPVFYWAIKLKGNYTKYRFLTLCMPLLLIGGLGSTLFHAFRCSSLLLSMDVYPIIFLTLSVSIYFWYKALKKWWLVLLAITPFILLRLYITMYVNLESHNHINLLYFLTGTTIFLPSLVLLIKTRFSGLKNLILACLLLILALLMREYDAHEQTYLSMGTHWLWHILCAIGAGYLGSYLYKLKEQEFLDKVQE